MLSIPKPDMLNGIVLMRLTHCQPRVDKSHQCKRFVSPYSTEGAEESLIWSSLVMDLLAFDTRMDRL